MRDTKNCTSSVTMRLQIAVSDITERRERSIIKRKGLIICTLDSIKLSNELVDTR
jgi:hypothetical protein